MRAEELIPGFRPETELEQALAGAPEVLEGLSWGHPRSGHPEGPVGTHVAHLLRTIDDWALEGARRAELRLIALVHDALKNRVNNLRPRNGENHHAVRARRVAERYIGDERLLATIELHDRPYALWRKMRWRRRLDEAGFERMMARIPDPDLFLTFVELDGSTEGKRPEPLRWFREELGRRGYLPRG